jgi:hypothetical protein
MALNCSDIKYNSHASETATQNIDASSWYDLKDGLIHVTVPPAPIQLAQSSAVMSRS